jgi:hypothetical protein
MKYASFWTNLVTDPWLLEIINQGHSLEFKEVPNLSLKVRWTILKDANMSLVLQNEVSELLKKEAIEVADPTSPGFYSTFFVVPKRDGGLRPVLNLKPLNQYIQYKKFRMETAASIFNYLRQGDWLVSIDLTDAYLHVPIRPSHRPFLRFAFNGEVYQFRVLPFGLSSAPRIFTMVLLPIAAHLHQRGIQFIPYLDDCLMIAKSPDQLRWNLQTALQVLSNAGFLVNYKKSSLIPTQDLVYLGMRLRTDLATVHLPESKAQVVIRCVQSFFLKPQVPASLCLRLLGLMTSCLKVVPSARLLMRPFQIFFLSRWNFNYQHLNHSIAIPQSVLQFLTPWLEFDRLVKGVPFHEPDPTRTITTDASRLGWGGHLSIHDSVRKVQGKWESQFQSLHINCLELLAVQRTLHSFRTHLAGHTVLVLTDNSSVRQYINKKGGTKSATLCALTLKMFRWCEEHNISLVAQHLPGVSNVLADSLSRFFAHDIEWRLHPLVVQSLFHLWGFPSIDLFASAANKHCPVFVSWRSEPEAYHVDALSLDWRGMYAYAFPPIPILPKVVQKVLRDRPELILITPCWPARPWFAQLLQLIVDDPRKLPLRLDLLSQDKGRLYHPNPAVWSPVAWRISSDSSRIKAYQRTNDPCI